MAKAPRTPCIGICSTGIGDDVCRGCKRFAQEVIEWNGYSIVERQAVMNRIDGFLVQVVATKFIIRDRQKLKVQVEYQQLQCDSDKDPHTWVFQLLKDGAGQIKNIEDFGIQIRSAFQNCTLVELKSLIDEEIYDLACSYYQRYIVPGMEQMVAVENT